MPSSEYQRGYEAYLNNEPFDSTRSLGWQDGWEDAELDDRGSDYEFFGD